MAEKKAKPMNKSQVSAALAEQTGLSKAQVNTVLAAIDDLMKAQLGKKGPGVFQLPGLLKVQLKKTAARTGRNPLTGETINIPAKQRVAARPLKALKDAVLN
jgi:nucleoid DNA-binding protein